jgi:aminopeptidase YwaD
VRDDGAGTGAVETGDEIEQRGFSGARATQKSEKLAMRDGERHVVDGADDGFAHDVVAGNLVKLDGWFVVGHKDSCWAQRILRSRALPSYGLGAKARSMPSLARDTAAPLQENEKAHKMRVRRRIVNRSRVVALAGCLLLTTGALAQKPPLLPEKDVAALANELSGETAKRNLEGIARFHRQRGSQGFHAAAELVAERLRVYGLSDVAILQFPADGKIFYGTQRSRPAWDAEKGELSEIRPGPPPVCNKEKVENAQVVFNSECVDLNSIKIASYEAEPIVLAEESESASVTAQLVEVGEGTKESDYAGKDVKGKIVLVSAQPGAVQDLAVGKFGAAGIVSYAQNQKTAWWGEDENLIRWGHLDTFSPNKTFAFMVSLKTARRFKERLSRGEKIMLEAHVKAGQQPGKYEVVTATIPGADPQLKEEEIAFSCHLDHQRPGANDNASGCATILEVARTLQKLISEGRLSRPARTIRFIFPPEIEGTLALLNAKPEFAKRIKAVVHMDMVGGGPETKAVFHVTRGPMSLPSFVHDVAWAFAEWVNEESYKFAATGSADYPLVAPEGGREPLRAEYSAYTTGSDHDVYQDSSFGIPAIYLNDWPDRYIHTNFDSAANIDPTKLKRATFIGGASGYFLAGMGDKDLRGVFDLLRVHTLRTAEALRRKRAQVEACDGGEIERSERDQVQPLVESVTRLAPDANGLRWPAIGKVGANISNNGEGICGKVILIPEATPIFSRKAEPKGPLAVFGYDYFVDHAKAVGVTTLKLLSYQGLWGGGEEYAYEVLNFADGKRNAQEIRDAVSAEYGPVPLEMVVEYLKALEKIGVVEAVK